MSKSVEESFQVASKAKVFCEEAAMIGEVVCAVCFCDFEDDSQVVWGPCIHPFHRDCITRFAREKRIKKLLSSLRHFYSRRKVVRKWNDLLEDFGGECALCRHSFKRCEVDWLQQEQTTGLPNVTKEEIYLYIPYDTSKRSFALRIWGYDQDEDVSVELDDGQDDGMDVEEENCTARTNNNDDEDDDVEFVGYHPATAPSQRRESSATPSQQREIPATPSQRRESRRISHGFSRIDRPRNRHRQNLNFQMHRLRQQGWSERQIEHHLRKHLS